MTEPTTWTTDHNRVDETFYVLFAEGGGWPDHCVGPFFDFDTAEEYLVSDKWRESWGSISDDPRDLPVHVLADTCSGCAAAIFRDRHGNYIDTTGGDACEDRHHHPQRAADQADRSQRVDPVRPVPTAANELSRSERTVPQFELDVDGVRAAFAEAVANDDCPEIWSESPGRAIENLFDCLAAGHLTCSPDAEAACMSVYAMVFDSQPDGVLIVVRRPVPLPALAAGPWGWDDLAPSDSLDCPLTIDEALGIVVQIVRYANELLARAGQPAGQ